MAAFGDEDMGVRPRRPQRRSRGASIIVATQADNDSDADDERLLSVPEDVVNALESDLAVEDRVREHISAFDRPCKFWGRVVADASSWCHNLLAPRGPFKTWLREMMMTRSLEQRSTCLT